MKQNNWPDWLPKSSRLSILLMEDQFNFILPVFTSQRGGGKYGEGVDGVSLCRHTATISGTRVSLKTFIRRFAYSDFDISNLTEALK